MIIILVSKHGTEFLKLRWKLLKNSTGTAPGLDPHSLLFFWSQKVHITFTLCLFLSLSSFGWPLHSILCDTTIPRNEEDVTFQHSCLCQLAFPRSLCRCLYTKGLFGWFVRRSKWPSAASQGFVAVRWLLMIPYERFHNWNTVSEIESNPHMLLYLPF